MVSGWFTVKEYGQDRFPRGEEENQWGWGIKQELGWGNIFIPRRYIYGYVMCGVLYMVMVSTWCILTTHTYTHTPLDQIGAVSDIQGHTHTHMVHILAFS